MCLRQDDRRPGVQVQQVPQVQSVRRQPRSHSCSSSYSCLDNVVACPLCATTCAWWFGVQKTATVAQLQCSDTVSGDFLGPCTQVQGRVVSTGTRPPIIRCLTFGGMDRHVINTHRQNHLLSSFPLQTQQRHTTETHNTHHTTHHTTTTHHHTPPHWDPPSVCFCAARPAHPKR